MHELRREGRLREGNGKGTEQERKGNLREKVSGRKGIGFAAGKGESPCINERLRPFERWLFPD